MSSNELERSVKKASGEGAKDDTSADTSNPSITLGDDGEDNENVDKKRRKLKLKPLSYKTRLVYCLNSIYRFIYYRSVKSNKI